MLGLFKKKASKASIEGALGDVIAAKKSLDKVSTEIMQTRGEELANAFIRTVETKFPNQTYRVTNSDPRVVSEGTTAFMSPEDLIMLYLVSKDKLARMEHSMQKFKKYYTTSLELFDQQKDMGLSDEKHKLLVETAEKVLREREVFFEGFKKSVNNLHNLVSLVSEDIKSPNMNIDYELWERET